MSSDDGVAWNSDNDSIGNDSIRTPAVFNGRLYVLSHSPNGFLLVSENGRDYAKEPIPDSILKGANSSFRFGFLATDGKKLYCATPEGIWTKDSMGFWEKASTNAQSELFNEYQKQISFKGKIYLSTEEAYRYPNAFVTIFHTTDMLSYTKISSLQVNSNYWGPGMPFLVSDSAVMIFQNDKRKIVYSTDLITWQDVGSFTLDFNDAIRFKNKNLLFSTNGSVYSIQ
jgi:hypothetical protein